MAQAVQRLSALGRSALQLARQDAGLIPFEIRGVVSGSRVEGVGNSQGVDRTSAGPALHGPCTGASGRVGVQGSRPGAARGRARPALPHPHVQAGQWSGSPLQMSRHIWTSGLRASNKDAQQAPDAEPKPGPGPETSEAGPTGEGEAPSSLEELRASLEAAQKTMEEERKTGAEAKDRMLRTLADMENLRERTARQLADTKQFAVQVRALGWFAVCVCVSPLGTRDQGVLQPLPETTGGQGGRGQPAWKWAS